MRPSGLSYFIYWNNLANFYQIMSWFMSNPAWLNTMIVVTLIFTSFSPLLWVFFWYFWAHFTIFSWNFKQMLLVYPEVHYINKFFMLYPPLQEAIFIYFWAHFSAFFNEIFYRFLEPSWSLFWIGLNCLNAEKLLREDRLILPRNPWKVLVLVLLWWS